MATKAPAPAKSAPAKAPTSTAPRPYVSPAGSSSAIIAQNRAQAAAVANKTPTQLYQSMSATQQASFSKANPTANVSNNGADLGPAINKLDTTTGKYTSIANPKQGYQEATPQPIVPTDTPQGTTGESPGTSTNSLNGGDTAGDANSGGGGQEKTPEQMGQHNQQVGGMNAGAPQAQGAGKSKQDVLNGAISRGDASVDQSGNVISKSGQNLGNISGMDMTQSSIGNFNQNPNENIQKNQEDIQAGNKQTQAGVNAIKQDGDLGLSNSPDSPFWNAFGNGAIEAEKNLPGYMNERNKIIASSLMLNNADMKYYSDAERKDAILKDIVDRQEGGVDPDMQSWYTKTIDNVNNLINRQLPAMKADDYFNALLKGENIPASKDTQNPQLSSARLRFNELQKYSSMDVNGLFDAIESGDLNKGGRLWNDLLNKGMGESLNKAYGMLNTKNETSVTDMILGDSGKFDPNKSLANQKSGFNFGDSLEGKLSAKIMSLMTEDKLPTFASFLLADEDVQKAKKASRATESEIGTLTEEINNFSDDIKTKVVEKGGEATDDPFLNAYIQEKTKPYNKKLSMLQSKYRNDIALLSDLSENARTEFETKEYNKNMQIKGYEFILGRVDKQNQAILDAKKEAQQQLNWDKTFGQQQKQNEIAQSNWNKSFALQNKQFERQKSKADTPNMQITGYDSDGKAVYQYYDQATNSWKSASGSNTGPTGQYANIAFGNKNIDVDTSILPALQSAKAELDANGIKVVVGQSKRDQTETIKGMASRYKIPFDATNPNKTAESLRKAGYQVANVGASKHETGTAIDIYASKGGAVDEKTKQILNSKGFYQTAGAGDLGHFEYLGNKENKGSSGETSIAQGVYNGTFTATDILNKKTLEKYGMQNNSRDSIVSAVNNSLFSTYLTKESTVDEIKSVVDRTKSVFPKDENAWIDPLKQSVGANKTFDYLMKNDLLEYDTDNEDAVKMMGSMLEKTFKGSKVDRNILYAGLKAEFGRSVANDLLDYLNM